MKPRTCVLALEQKFHQRRRVNRYIGTMKNLDMRHLTSFNQETTQRCCQPASIENGSTGFIRLNWGKYSSDVKRLAR